MDNRTPDSSSGSQHPHLPPGFRFHPTDEELLVHYLKRKASSAPLPVAIIAEIDLYKFDPWELPSKAAFGEEEWYFFSPRDRKYPNGARPNRAATSGYWKATGTDKPILASDGNQKVGVKKALVFYGGKPPKGVKTNWIMHEYRLADNNSFNSSSTSNKPPRLAADPPHTSNKNNSLRLDDWVLCRIYKKSNSNTLPRPPLKEQDKELSRSTSTFGAAGLDNDDNFFDGILASDQSMQNNGCDSHNSKGNSFTVKQALTSEFWNNETGSPAGSSSSKRFHSDLNCGNSNAEENNSFVSLLSQIPQNAATFHPSAILGSIGDGVLRQQFQIQGINWDS